MGVLNVTPDSFSDGGNFFDVDTALVHAQQMALDGADSIDVGGESSRPGSDPVSTEEELSRVLPVLEKIKQELDILVSIDTYKPQVAKAALEAGADMVNDISGLGDSDMIEVVSNYNVPVVIMHMRGKPKTMQKNPVYNDIIEDIKTFFAERIEAAKKGGIKKIILDPGIGFGKTLEHNLTILRELSRFKNLDYPILVGTSRKSFIGTITGQEVDKRLEGTIASNVIAIMNGANIIRVHDVKELKAAALVADAIKYA